MKISKYTTLGNQIKYIKQYMKDFNLYLYIKIVFFRQKLQTPFHICHNIATY